MSEHLTLERLSAVLDEPGADGAAVAHLDACAECQREYEEMSRVRMSLSGLADLEAPAGAWAQIEAALPAASAERPETPEPPVIEIRPRRRAFGLFGAWPLQAAAALILFAGGLTVGIRLRQAGMTGDAPSVAATQEAGSVARPAIDAGQASYQDALSGLEELRLRTVSTEVDPADDPAAAAARLIHLDALVAASREALRESPEDPAVNHFLFEVIDERDALNAQLSDVLHAATAEYR